MQFIHGSLLLGLIALVIPVLIHLFYRQKPKPTAIPTLMFIEQAMQQSSSSRKLKSSVLLIMRMLLIALPVFLLAQPYLPGVQDSDATKHVIIIDNSYYNENNLNISKDLAIDVLEKLPEGSAVRLAGTQFEDKEFSFIHDELKERIKLLTPQNSIINFSSLIKQEDKDTTQYHCITDFNSQAWNGELPNIKNISFYDVKPSRFNNYIESITSPEKFTLNQASDFSVKLAGDMPFSGMKIQMIENDKLIKEKTIPLSDSKNIDINFTFTPTKNNFSLEFKLLIEDKLEEDNSYYFVGKAAPPLKIYILQSDNSEEINPGLLTELILSQFPEYEINNFKLNKIPTDGDTYFISTELREKDWQNFEKLTALGKNLVLWPQQGAILEQWNKRTLPIFSSALYNGNIDGLNSSNLKLRDFENELEELDLNSAYYLNDSKSSSTALESFNDKEIISSIMWRSGRVTFCGLPVNDKTISSNFIAPLIYSIFQNKIELNDYNLSCFEPISNTPSGQYTIINPAGLKENIDAQPYTKTEIPGIYNSSFGEIFAVNLPKSPNLYQYLIPKEKNTEAKKQSVFSISSSFMMIVLMIVLLLFNLGELYISQREAA